jgi:hypothetical protein
MRASRRARLTVLAQEPQNFRRAENSSKALAGKGFPIVHTGRAFDPTAQQAAQQETTARAFGQARQGGR